MNGKNIAKLLLHGNIKNTSNTTPEEKKEKKKPLSKSDQDMIDELDYEYKKAHKPYDKYERHWDEA